MLSSSDWRRRPVKYTWRTLHFAVLVLLVIWCLGPLLLLAKFAFTPTQDILTQPLAIFPNGPTLRQRRSGLEQVPHRPLLPEHGVGRARILVQPDTRRDDGWFRALRAAAPMVPSPQLGSARHAVRAGRGAARAALPDHRRPADRAEPHQQLPGGVATRRRDRVQRRARRALLRLAAAGDLRGSSDRRRWGATDCSGRSCSP